MTICERVGTFQTEIFHRVLLFGDKAYKVELDVVWISTGYYSIKILPINPSNEIGKLYPAPECISLAPEWIQKVFELYPTAEKQPRDKLYEPFYEDFHTDASMIDMGHDTLFQAFKDQSKDRVILTTHTFLSGVPSEKVSMLYMTFEEFKKFKEFLHNGIMPFFTNMQINWNDLVQGEQ